MNTKNIKLYTYFRSSASYRVRIALYLKNISFESIPIDLRKGEQKHPSYTSMNAQSILPFFVTDDVAFSQSLTILEYLEAHYPKSPLLPPVSHPLHWKARSLAHYIACEIHPLNNLRVLHYLTQTLHVNDAQKNAWYHHWIHEGFHVLEKELSPFETPYSVWEEPTWVDLCLIPQMYNARRFGVDLSSYPRLQRIAHHCMQHDAFILASPEKQEDCDL